MFTSRLVIGAALALVGSAGVASAQYPLYRSPYSYPQVYRPAAGNLLLGASRIALGIGSYSNYGYGSYGYGGFNRGYGGNFNRGYGGNFNRGYGGFNRGYGGNYNRGYGRRW